MKRFVVLIAAVALTGCTTARSGAVAGDPTPTEIAAAEAATTPSTAASTPLPSETPDVVVTASTAPAAPGFGLSEAPGAASAASPSPAPVDRSQPRSADTSADSAGDSADADTTKRRPAEASPTPEPERQPRREDASRLWGRTFVSRSVTDDGSRVELVDGTRIRVSFEQRRAGDSVRWHAGCNTAGGKVAVSPDRLDVTEIASTAVGCPDERQRQDAWVNRFFGSRPFWRLAGDRLTLRVDDTVIRFRES